MKNTKKAAKGLAALGRFGDNRILHVSDAEIQGIERLIGRKLPTNPATGAKEAFFFLPFLAGLGSLFAPAAAAAAPIAAAAAPLAGAATGALGAGMAAGMGAGAAAALPTAAAAAAPALAATAAPTAAGLISAAPVAAHTAAAAAPTIAGGAGINSLIGAAGPLAGPAETAQFAAHAASVGPFAGGAGIGSPYAPAITSAIPGSNLPVSAATAVNAASHPIMGGAGIAAQKALATAAPAAAKDAGTGLAGFLGKMDPTTMLMMGSMLPSMLGGMGGGGGEKKDKDAEKGAKTQYQGGNPEFPGKDYDPGVSGEWNYFPHYKVGFSEGGMVNHSGLGKILHAMACGGMIYGKAAGYAAGGEVNPLLFGQVNPAIDPEKLKQMRGGLSDIFDNIQDIKLVGPEAVQQANMGYAPQGISPYLNNLNMHGTPGDGTGSAGVASMMKRAGSLMTSAGDVVGGAMKPAMQQTGPLGVATQVKRYAAGGPVGLEAMQQQAMPMPDTASMGDAPEPGTIPQSPYPKSQVGTESEDDKELIAQAVQAIKGQSPDPNAALLQFVKVFGEDALKDLVNRVKMLDQKASVRKMDGMSDGIPAVIDGQQPAALSSGEFVVPADVVSGLGNGSTEAGAAHLNGMMDRVRHARTGKKAQPKAIDGAAVLPV
jgi:hypothetical protein